MDDIYQVDIPQDDIYQDPYEEPYQDEYTPAPEPKRGMSAWLIALIVLLALLVVCCICLCAATALLLPTIETMGITIMETVEAMTPMP
jgi:hypothetical protein